MKLVEFSYSLFIWLSLLMAVHFTNSLPIPLLAKAAKKNKETKPSGALAATLGLTSKGKSDKEKGGNKQGGANGKSDTAAGGAQSKSLFGGGYGLGYHGGGAGGAGYASGGGYGCGCGCCCCPCCCCCCCCCQCCSCCGCGCGCCRSEKTKGEAGKKNGAAVKGSTTLSLLKAGKVPAAAQKTNKSKKVQQGEENLTFTDETLEFLNNLGKMISSK